MIKFKIWDSQNKVMLTQCAIDYLVDAGIKRKYPIAVNDPCEYSDGWHIREGLTFLRYTGFKDMLDEEIYEGDLLEDGDKVISAVLFSNDEGQWWVTPGDLEILLNGEDAVPLSQFLSDNPDAEVIGNKHTTQMFTYCHDSKLWKKSV
jgi:hypothetical protein